MVAANSTANIAAKAPMPHAVVAQSPQRERARSVPTPAESGPGAAARSVRVSSDTGNPHGMTPVFVACAPQEVHMLTGLPSRRADGRCRKFSQMPSFAGAHIPSRSNRLQSTSPSIQGERRCVWPALC